MPSEDQQRWDERYREDIRYQQVIQPHSFLVEHAHLLPAGGLAIDFATGLGANAGFLLERGFRVIGVDISPVALRRARRVFPDLIAVQADLERFPFALPANGVDVILNFFYLQRELFPVYARALRPGGLLVMETLTRDFQAVHPEIEGRYLLQPGELRAAFRDLEILDYREGWNEGRQGHRRATAAVVARKPARSPTP